MASSRSSSNGGGAAYRRWLLWAVGIFLVAWIAFFDSHSLLKRVQWRMEYEELESENEQLREDIDRIRTRIEELESDAMIEEIAREQYGMSRPGETVYRVKPEK